MSALEIIKTTDVQKLKEWADSTTNEDELIQAISGCMGMTISSICMTAVLVKRCSVLGIPVRNVSELYRTTLIGIADGVTIPDVYALFDIKKQLEVRRLPLDQQRSIADGELFDVLTNDNQVEKKSVAEMTTEEFKRVCSGGKFRSVEEQRPFLRPKTRRDDFGVSHASRKNANESTGTNPEIIDARREMIRITESDDAGVVIMFHTEKLRMAIASNPDKHYDPDDREELEALALMICPIIGKNLVKVQRNGFNVRDRSRG